MSDVKEEQNSEAVVEETPVDLTASLADISSDLFGSSEEGASVVEETSGEAGQVDSGASAESASAVPDPSSNSEAVDELGAPKSWTKEAIAEWATLPPTIKAEVLKREDDFFKGIEQYKEGAAVGKAYQSVVEPYTAALAAENINPVDLFKAFAANHYTLSRGTPEQKLALVGNLIKGYGIDIDQLTAQFEPAPWVDPEIKALREQVARLEQNTQSLSQRDLDAKKQEIQATVEAFANDPANIHWDKVSHLIPNLIQSGLAKDLPDAYKQAVMLNDETREAEIARRQADAKAKADRENEQRLAAARAASAANVKTSAKQRDATVPVGSMDDTLNATMERIRQSS